MPHLGSLKTASQNLEFLMISTVKTTIFNFAEVKRSNSVDCDFKVFHIIFKLRAILEPKLLYKMALVL